jgi:hypothetical protein
MPGIEIPGYNFGHAYPESRIPNAFGIGIGNTSIKVPMAIGIGTTDVVSMEFIPSSSKQQCQKPGIKIPGYNFGHPKGIRTFATDQCHWHDRYCIDGIYSIDYNKQTFLLTLAINLNPSTWQTLIIKYLFRRFFQ